jgi:mono/diheme cytochrome c family protein
MSTFGNALLGLVFVLLGLVATLLMYKLWGYPFDHEKLESSAPKPLMRLHRLVGWAYFGLYVFLMWQMVPRLFTYQVELPARTVAHLILGMAIGALLFVKIVIVRFFKHLEGTMAPFLGTGLLVCTLLLIGLSVPFAFRALGAHAKGDVFGEENVARVARSLPEAGLPKGVDPAKFASRQGLKIGRDVLLGKCVQCHDLRTVLVRPKTPDAWVSTVARMAERSVFTPITEDEEWAVAAYLIAISPELQEGARKKRQERLSQEEAKSAAVAIAPVPAAHDIVKAKALFAKTCSQCHEAKDVDAAPPKSHEDAKALVARMVDNGLEAPASELEEIVFYLDEAYVKGTPVASHVRTSKGARSVS